MGLTLKEEEPTVKKEDNTFKPQQSMNQSYYSYGDTEMRFNPNGDLRSQVYLAAEADRKKEREQKQRAKGTFNLFTWLLDIVFGTHFGRFFRRNRW